MRALARAKNARWSCKHTSHLLPLAQPAICPRTCLCIAPWSDCQVQNDFLRPKCRHLTLNEIFFARNYFCYNVLIFGSWHQMQRVNESKSAAAADRLSFAFPASRQSVNTAALFKLVIAHNRNIEARAASGFLLRAAFIILYNQFDNNSTRKAGKKHVDDWKFRHLSDVIYFASRANKRALNRPDTRKWVDGIEENRQSYIFITHFRNLKRLIL